MLISEMEDTGVEFHQKKCVAYKNDDTRFHDHDFIRISFCSRGKHPPHCQAATQSKAALESISLVEVGIRERDDFGRGCY